MQSFKDTPFFFFTHGSDHDRLIVDGIVYQMNVKDKSCRKIQQIGLDLVGGCALESSSKDIVLSHGDCFAFSLWSWNGIDYVKRQFCKFSFDKDKIASMLRYNKYSRG